MPLKDVPPELAGPVVVGLDTSVSMRCDWWSWQPYGSSQTPEREDILNIGGFSDAVFNVVSSFLESDASRFVREVESVEL